MTYALFETITSVHIVRIILKAKYQLIALLSTLLFLPIIFLNGVVNNLFIEKLMLSYTRALSIYYFTVLEYTEDLMRTDCAYIKHYP